MHETSPTLFDKYGGVPAVRELVRRFHERFLAKPTLRRYFDNVDSQKLIEHQAGMIAYALEKPMAGFDPQQMPAHHYPHSITLSAFEQVINILRQVLLEANVEGRDIARIIHRMDSQRHRIVRDAPPLSNVYDPELVDTLTGLGNRAALQAALQQECANYLQNGRALSLALMRPTAGLHALTRDPRALQLLDRHLAGTLGHTVREADVLCRLEDGLFALVLRATDAAKAMQAAKRIQAAVARERLAAASNVGVELAAGLASAGGMVTSPAQLVAAADAALQRAITGGVQKIVAA